MGRIKDMEMFTFFKRKIGDIKWMQIEEDQFHHDLYKEFIQTTPIIKAMLNGKHTICLGSEYKLEKLER